MGPDVAAVALMLRVRETELAEALALDMAAPLFWPALPLSAFVEAVRADYLRQVLRRRDLFDAKEAAEEAERAIGVRVAAILSLRSELAGHFWRRTRAGGASTSDGCARSKRFTSRS